jgi:uncharacterized protein YqeY
MSKNQNEGGPAADPPSAESVRARIQRDLRSAMKARDAVKLRTLRVMLAALDNASAVEQTEAHVPVIGRSSDVPRKALAEDDLVAILRREVAERTEAMEQYARLQRREDADRLLAELSILSAYLPSDPQRP